MSGVLTRAESRALRMTAENGECALEFKRLPPYLRLSCGADAVTHLRHLKRCGGIRGTQPQVSPNDFFATFFVT